MKIDVIPEPIQFEWDKGNIDKNFKGHEVGNEEAEDIFLNEETIFSEDIKHSKKERRFQALGLSAKGRKLFISFTIRKNKVRIISARDMSKKERKAYD